MMAAMLRACSSQGNKKFTHNFDWTFSREEMSLVDLSV
jgi:hypothetical protein